MPQSLANILVHLVFSTKNREPFITHDLRDDLHAYLGGTLRNNGCHTIVVGGVEDHVHSLFALSRTMTIAQVTEKLKTGSAHWAKERQSHLQWQARYGAFSIGAREVDTITNYILNQDAHHRKVSFQEEFRALLQEAGISFDERYLWD